MITKKERVRFADENSRQTNILRRNVAPKVAALNFVGVKDVELLGTEPVYNMEVVGNHNFSINGGLIVHNCMDSIRYLAYTVLSRYTR